MDKGETKITSGEVGKISGGTDSKQGGERDRSTGTANTAETGKRGTEAKQGIPGLAVVEVPGDEKPKEKKKSDTKKKRQTKEQKKAAEVKELAGNLSVLIKTGFDITAMRLGPVWEVTDEECKKIADPLARILERYGILEKAAEYSDFASLAVAAGSVVIPRCLIYADIKKKEEGGKGEKAGKVKPAIKRDSKEGEFIPSSGGNIKELVPGLSL